MTEMWLVRHGQTDWNLAGRFQGQTDIPLNSTGLQQAGSLAQLLKKEKFDAIFSSDLQRAYQTAQIASSSLYLPVVCDQRLREISQGQWEGLSLVEVQTRFHLDPRDGDKQPDTAHAPGGESVRQVADRMIAAANAIARAHPSGKILLVSHGLSVAVLYCVSQGIPLVNVHQYIPDNASPLIIHYFPQ